MIKVPGRPGDAAACVAGEWFPVFGWRDGSVAFNASKDFNNPADPIREIAADLAGRLGGVLVGDDGKRYE